MNHRDAWTTWSGRGTRLLTGVLVAGVLGCGAETEQGHSPDPAPDPSTAPADDPCPPGAEAERAPEPDPEREQLPRMCAVAGAWEASDAADRWAAEFHPLDPVVELPEGGLRDESDTRAFENGSFKAPTSLPDEPAEGSIRWEDREAGPVPLLSAADAFGELDSGIDDHSPDFHALQVTGVELGEMRLRTSRGPADVPAWLFTLDGYDTPLRHAAVPVPEPPAAPVGPVAEDDGEHRPVGLEALGPVGEDGRQVTVTLLTGSCDELAVDVLETDDSVVLAASVVGGPPPGTACTAEVRTVGMTVDLERPLAERAPLDAHTGEALHPTPIPPPE